MRWPLRVPAAVLALATAAVLSGCSPELPRPVPSAAPDTPPPATTLEQSDRILRSVGSVLEAGDAARSAAELAPRVSGPALAARTAEYAVATATAGAQPVTELPLQAQTLVVPATTEWPRTQLVVTEQPNDLTSPRLLVLRQESARTPYQLWGWARLVPGVEMPIMAAPAVGSAPVAPDAQDLVATPADVVTQYADVLLNGEASASFASFASPDPYRERIIADQRAPYQALATQGGGTYTETFAAVPDQVFAQATADGGALVVAGMTSGFTLTATGASVNVPTEIAAVSGGTLPVGAVVRNSMSTTFTDVLAFYVPPASTGGPIRVLAGEHTYTSSSGS